MQDREKEYQKEWYKKNKEHKKRYLIQNKDSIKQKRKEYYKNNINKIIEYRKVYYENNKEKIRESSRIYRLKNRELKNRYETNKRRTDENFRVSNNLRRRLKIALDSQKTQKKNKTLCYLGCSKEYLLTHLGDRQCNYCHSVIDIQIDHIYPLSKIDLSKEENIYKVMNYTNLQYLCKGCNIKKRDKVLQHKC